MVGIIEGISLGGDVVGLCVGDDETGELVGVAVDGIDVEGLAVGAFVGGNVMQQVLEQASAILCSLHASSISFTNNAHGTFTASGPHRVGAALGIEVKGENVGNDVGNFEGAEEGVSDGFLEGEWLGFDVGSKVGV